MENGANKWSVQDINWRRLVYVFKAVIWPHCFIHLNLWYQLYSKLIHSYKRRENCDRQRFNFVPLSIGIFTEKPNGPESFLSSGISLIVLKIFPHFVEPKVSLACSQKPATQFYSDAISSIKHSRIRDLWGLLYVNSHLHLGIPNGLLHGNKNGECSITPLRRIFWPQTEDDKEE